MRRFLKYYLAVFTCLPVGVAVFLYVAFWVVAGATAEGAGANGFESSRFANEATGEIIGVLLQAIAGYPSLTIVGWAMVALLATWVILPRKSAAEQP